MAGILSDAEIEGLIKDGAIPSGTDIEKGQVQACSFDIRLGRKALRIPASVRSVEEARKSALYDFDITEGGVLEAGLKYAIEIEEGLKLPPHISAYANPKSSIGRCNVQVKLIAEDGKRFDKVPAGYDGKLMIDVTPTSFISRVRSGESFNQLRFFEGDMADARMSEAELTKALVQHGIPILYNRNREPIEMEDIKFDEDGIILTAYLVPNEKGVVAYISKRDDKQLILDLTKGNGKNPRSYFYDEVKLPNSRLKMVREAFYLIRTSEMVSMPLSDTAWIAAEMLPYDVSTGEFRSHSAGFIDYGFGNDKHGGPDPTALMMEVTPHDDIMVSDGVDMCKLVFYKVTSKPKGFYGSASKKSHYLGQPLSAGKYFDHDK